MVLLGRTDKRGRHLRLVLISALALVSLALRTAPAHAQAARYGFRLASGYGAGSLEQVEGEIALVEVAVERPLLRQVHAHLQLGLGTMPTPNDVPNMDAAKIDRSWHTALVAGLDLRAPIRGHASPFLRAGAGLGAIRTGAVHVLFSESGVYGPHDSTAETHLAPVASAAVGFGRVPCEGLGFEVGLEASRFAAARVGFSALAFTAGLVY